MDVHGIAVRTKAGRRFEELLWEWINVVERTVRRWPDDDDAAWMYNERASISIFGGAVWRMGGVVFEEFVTDKPNRPQPGHDAGRGDLFFEYGGRDYIVEAKQCTPLITRPAPDAIFTALEAAKADARATNPYTYVPLAMIFASPRLARRHSDQRDSLIKNWVGELAKLRTPALGWTFPAAAHRKGKQGYLRPGIAILITDDIEPARSRRLTTR